MGSSDAADEDQLAGGKCRLGYVAGWTLSTLQGTRHISQRAPKLVRGTVNSSIGGEVYALSGMADHMLLLGDFWALRRRDSWRGGIRVLWKPACPLQDREDDRREDGRRERC